MTNQNAIHMLNTVQKQTGEKHIYNMMNSFIITTEDGKLIVIDGGQRVNAENLISYLKKVSGENIPHIDAWFLTHAHNDHVDAFLEVIQHHADEVEIEKVYMNFPSIQFFANVPKPDKSAVGTAKEIYGALPLFADKLCICSAGDVYEIGEAKFEILYSTDPYITSNVCNNSSIVFKMSLGGRTALFLADCGVEAGNRILERFKGTDTLKCDICQMAHHGQGGVDKEFYAEVSPEICLWCTPDWLWDNDMGKGFDTHCFQTVTVRRWMDEIGSVKKHYVTKDGDQVCLL